MNKLLAFGIFIFIVVAIIFVYQFMYKGNNGNRVRALELGVETYTSERNEVESSSIKTRIVTRDPVEGEKVAPVALNADDIKITQIFIVVGEGVKRRVHSIMKDGRSQTITHTIDIDNDKLGIDMMVKQSVCSSIKNDAPSGKPHGCSGKSTIINGESYQLFTQNEDTLFSELNVVNEDDNNYYELEIYINNKLYNNLSTTVSDINT